jgi:hypothetical protein
MWISYSCNDKTVSYVYTKKTIIRMYVWEVSYCRNVEKNTYIFLQSSKLSQDFDFDIKKDAQHKIIQSIERSLRS